MDESDNVQCKALMLGCLLQSYMTFMPTCLLAINIWFQLGFVFFHYKYLMRRGTLPVYIELLQKYPFSYKCKKKKKKNFELCEIFDFWIIAIN